MMMIIRLDFIVCATWHAPFRISQPNRLKNEYGKDNGTELQKNVPYVLYRIPQGKKRTNDAYRERSSIHLARTTFSYVNMI